MITHLPILADEEVTMVPLIQLDQSWAPIPFLITGTYDDYGGIENYSSVMDQFLAFLSQYSAETLTADYFIRGAISFNHVVKDDQEYKYDVNFALIKSSVMHKLLWKSGFTFQAYTVNKVVTLDRSLLSDYLRGLYNKSPELYIAEATSFLPFCPLIKRAIEKTVLRHVEDVITLSLLLTKARRFWYPTAGSVSQDLDTSAQTIIMYQSLLAQAKLDLKLKGAI